MQMILKLVILIAAIPNIVIAQCDNNYGLRLEKFELLGDRWGQNEWVHVEVRIRPVLNGSDIGRTSYINNISYQDIELGKPLIIPEKSDYFKKAATILIPVPTSEQSKIVLAGKYTGWVDRLFGDRCLWKDFSFSIGDLKWEALKAPLQDRDGFEFNQAVLLEVSNSQFQGTMTLYRRCDSTETLVSDFERLLNNLTSIGVQWDRLDPADQERVVSKLPELKHAIERLEVSK